ncbi:hypothetical protein X798_05417 [Onchocerca flexuosa]|uniref:Uncharacterized protein n=1 Tax=Onchocerca flexuosa TaxID=387005 RepID=A0A238BQN3_9BILA|nr:hypothetical protein X798_05417 [Onchocerca flexuosa]
MNKKRRNDDLEYRAEDDHAHVRRMIRIVMILLTVIAIIMVVFSLLFGSKIDELVNELNDESVKISSNGLFLGPKTNITNFGNRGDSENT